MQQTSEPAEAALDSLLRKMHPVAGHGPGHLDEVDVRLHNGKAISDSYLRWRGIEATLQLAQSTNSKLVIIGSGKDGLPIILGNSDMGAAAALPTEDGAGRKHDTPAVGPATPMEKLQASNLVTPNEKMLSESEKSTDKTSADGAKPRAVGESLSARSIPPFSFLDLASYYLRLLRPSSEIKSDLVTKTPSEPTTTGQTQ